jgi:hypothetical protein
MKFFLLTPLRNYSLQLNFITKPSHKRWASPGLVILSVVLLGAVMLGVVILNAVCPVFMLLITFTAPFLSAANDLPRNNPTKGPTTNIPRMEPA